MSTIKKGKKLTVSTGDGINRTQTQSLGVLEISGKGVSGLTTEYSYDWYNTNDEHKKAQLVIGKTDGADDSTLQLAVDTSGNSIIEALAYNDPNKHILMQVLGGNVGIGTASPFEKLDLGASGGNIRMSGISDGDNAPDRSIGRYDSGNTFKCGITFGNTSGLHDYISFTTHEYNVSSPERMRIDYNGNVGIGTINPRCTMDISATDALIIPVGTEAQRPTNLSNGMIRYNTSTVQFEGYGPGGEWGSLGGIKDVDGDTYIEAETSAGTDNDDLKFFTSGNQRMIIDSSGNVGIGTTSPDNHLLHLKGSYPLKIESSTDSSWYTIFDYNQISSYGDDLHINHTNNKNVFLACGGGNVGIGTHSTSAKLHVNGNTVMGDSFNTGLTHKDALLTLAGTHNTGYNVNGKIKLLITGANNDGSSPYDIMCEDENGHDTFFLKSPSEGVLGTNGILYQRGRIGIGTTNPKYPLHVNSSLYARDAKGIGYYRYNKADGFGGNHNWNTEGAYLFSALFNQSIASLGSFHVMGSDRRIKKNIIDVPDDLALEQVRNIPCRYYSYIDTVERGTSESVIGFIAQEVRDVFPYAVKIISYWIPNEYRSLSNFTWEKTEIDSSYYYSDENTNNNNNVPKYSKCVYKLTTDIQEDVSGVKYRFYVSNDVSGNDEIVTELVGNSDNTFTFDISYNNVFCYGKFIDDFHTIDKSKIFTLHHSAIQEIDRLQQADKAKIAELGTKNTALEGKVSALETTLSDLLTRIASLEGST
jgi:hypothetical protein